MFNSFMAKASSCQPYRSILTMFKFHPVIEIYEKIGAVLFMSYAIRVINYLSSYYWCRGETSVRP